MKRESLADVCPFSSCLFSKLTRAVCCARDGDATCAWPTRVTCPPRFRECTLLLQDTLHRRRHGRLPPKTHSPETEVIRPLPLPPRATVYANVIRTYFHTRGEIYSPSPIEGARLIKEVWCFAPKIEGTLSFLFHFRVDVIGSEWKLAGNVVQRFFKFETLRGKNIQPVFTRKRWD